MSTMYVHIFYVAPGREHAAACVYESSSDSILSGMHSSFTSSPDRLGAGRWLGRLGCRPLPPELDALRPGSSERCAAVQAFHGAQYDLAYRLIAQALPALGLHPQARRSMGNIDVYSDPALVEQIRALQRADRDWIAVATEDLFPVVTTEEPRGPTQPQRAWLEGTELVPDIDDSDAPSAAA